MYNPFSLEGKTILVTGASSGIGRATAIECSKMGAKLIITGRNEDRLKKTFESLSGNEHSYVIADLTKGTDLFDLIDVLPVLDGCVNNAGITKNIPLSFIKEKTLEEVFAINTISPIFLLQKIVKMKKIATGASIVFTSSISGVYCSAVASSLYSASKGAINGFVKSAALDLASKQIRVNSVNPGMIDTDIFNEGIISQKQLEMDKLKYPLKRYGKPEEVAYAVIYLLSDASQWVTGSNIVIDGGYTLL
ncbi:MAG: SDR family oxidoreductase [Bacteroidales bacterium]|jgi:NAD(P)-dependent dehydrogenase (short-subunit alcohol dehydrogenase family)|nr:SDR family oxidoreductase [Bacteroidales bacterium]